jgi:Zn-dependent M28 family amino/carboxypeptidase
MMQYFSTHPPEFSILFIATSAEELGLLGSRFFTENPLVELSKIRFLVNLDLVGTGEEGIMVVNASLFNKEFNGLKTINSENGFLRDIKTRGAACNSDHCPFFNKGIPCFYIYTLGGNAAYHAMNDKPETLSLAEFENCTKLLIKFIQSFK